MKIRRLDLIAFGPFDGTELDLSAPGLQVVYGPNEAGKSTALRSIVGLLYGIPHRTGDAHRHRTTDLRIGAVIEHGDQVIDVVRRKGRTKTLLDRDDEPIDEAALLGALGGVPESLYRRMFGLDHRSLREGAEAMLRGEGGLAESLFDAGGAGGIRQVLQRLRDEADGIFLPRGKNQSIAVTLQAITELRERIKGQSTDAPKVTLQRDTLEELRQERATLDARRAEVETALGQARRARRVWPRLTKRRELITALDALGRVPSLPADAGERRLELQQAIDRAREDGRRIEAERQELRAARARLALDDDLAEAPRAVWEELEDALGRHRSALRDRPKRESELHRIERELAVMQRDRGREPMPLDALDGLHVDRATARRITNRAREHAALMAERARPEEATIELPDAPEVPSPGEEERLEAALRQARVDGELDTRITQVEARLRRLDTEVAAMAEALGAAAEDASGWQVPSAELMTAWHERATQAATEARDDARREAELTRHARQNVQSLTELETLGEVPTAAQLRAARARRDAIVATWSAGHELIQGELEGLARAIETADHVGDRMRAEAERVARYARLTAEGQAIQSELEQLAVNAKERARNQRELAHEMAAAWPEGAPALTAQAPGAWLSWLERHGRLVGAVEEAATLRTELSTMRAARGQRVLALATALGDAADEANLRGWIERGEVRRDVWRRAREAHDRHREAVSRQEREQERRRAERDAVEAKWKAWQGAWAEAVEPLGLAPDVSVEDAQEELEARQALLARAVEAEGLIRRLRGMDRDATAFEEKVADLVGRYRPSLAGESPAAAADALLIAARKADEAARRRDDLDARDAKQAERLAEVEHAAREAEVALRGLLRAAEVDDAAELPDVEKRVREHAELSRRKREEEEALFEEGTLEELEALVADYDPDSAALRIAELETRREQLEEELQRVDQNIGGVQTGLDRMASREGAARAKSELESHLAAYQQQAERWAKLKLAERILAQEIEAYRERHQGPVVARAGELFPRLTLGEYRGLRVAFGDDDRPELRCVGSDGSEVALEGLSDGARDQLYLALRIASLERFAERAELLPVVADDILIHFDEDRARASLEVLGELTRRGQVLLFTHHARHVELAEEALGERLTVHRLAAGHRRVAPSETTRASTEGS